MLYISQCYSTDLRMSTVGSGTAVGELSYVTMIMAYTFDIPLTGPHWRVAKSCICKPKF